MHCAGVGKGPRGAKRGATQRTESAVKRLLMERSAVLLAHYYVEPDIQDLAEETGGCVADSLEMARFGRAQAAPTLVVAGVRFMGETAKILNPEKRVLMPDLDASCSLDLGCPADEFSAFCDQHPERTVVVYANTSAESRRVPAGWSPRQSRSMSCATCTRAGRRLLWAPDGISAPTFRVGQAPTCCLWHGACVVHEEFKALELEVLKKEHPRAKVLVHPESPAEVIKLADAVGSTTQIIKAAQALDADEFIVATDNGMLHKLKMLMPEKRFIEAPTAGASATCKSLRALPLDGDERPREPRRGARDRRERDPHRSGNRSPRVPSDRSACSPSPRAVRSRCAPPAISHVTARCSAT